MIKKIQDANVKNKIVILRLDLNIPYSNGQSSDISRIERSKKTILFLTENGNKVVILSHFGRPDGKKSKALSLKNLLGYLQDVIGINITFLHSHDIELCTKTINTCPFPSVFLLENLRFSRLEETNDPDFSFKLASLGDVYCNDAFSVSHRAHASTQGITNYLPSFAGFLVQNELKALSKALNQPLKPVTAIVGGSKISSKIEILNNLIDKVDFLVIGGAMANTFLDAQGYGIGSSLTEKKMLKTAKTILQHLESKNCKMILPKDIVCASSLKIDSDTYIFNVECCPADKMILDIGPQTQQTIINVISKSRTLIWNGPLGAFETPPFDEGTNNIAKYVAKMTFKGQINSIAGGGDTLSALKGSGSESQFGYVSTAGGAFLEWLEGKSLPGIESLKK